MAAYKIVSNEGFTDTEEQVNELLQDGWLLHGDLKVTDTAYVQAMVRWGDYEGGNDVSVYLQESFEDAIRSIGEKIEDSLETGLANLATAVGHRDQSK
jgi:hypothetical protein